MEGIEYSSSEGQCHLLRIPKEIRLSIYRYLLLPNPNGMIGITPGNFFEEDWSDMDGDGIEEILGLDSDTDDEMDDGEAETYITSEEANPFKAEDDEAYKKHPAILRTNKKIYQEAISMFHEEAVLIVEPGDIFCLRKTAALEFGAAHLPVWRHNPLNGWKDINGVAKYNTPEMEGGLLDPHVFARFQKVYFDANFDFEHTQHIEFWIDDTTHTIRKTDAEEYQRILRSSSVMKDFVQVVQRSQLASLEIALEVEVMANSELMMEEMLNESDDEAVEVEEKIDALMKVANERATEMFLDSGICEPLMMLTNVQQFDLNFGFEHREEEDKYKPKPKHMKLIKQMKKTIEGQWGT